MAVAIAADDIVGRSRSEVRRSIRALMGINGITQSKLAAVLHISQPNLSQRLKGQVAFSEDQLAVIADTFGLEVPDLYSADEAVRKAAAVTLWIVPDIHSEGEQLTILAEIDANEQREKLSVADPIAALASAL